MNLDAEVLRTRAVVGDIRPLLAGQPPGVQGAVLMELLSLFLAGHPPAARESVLTMHIAQVRTMVPIVERELFGGKGHPATRDD